MSPEAVSPLRRRMIEDMTIRQFGEKTRRDYIRQVREFTAFLGRSPDRAERDVEEEPQRCAGQVHAGIARAERGQMQLVAPEILRLGPVR